MHKYSATIDNGIGGTRSFWAENVNEALEEAVAWARQGDWTSPAVFRVRVVNEENDEDTAERLVEMAA